MTDPYLVLGVERSADDETIRAAYLAAIRSCPPERDRERFARVRAAYEAIAREPDRLAHELFDTAAPSAQEVLERLRSQWTPGPPTAANLLRLLGGA
jgi:curved DNA-binding protein CbpA